jgi:hypothetical protein
MAQGRGLTIGTSAALLRRTWHRTAIPARLADSTMAAWQTIFPAAANPVSAAACMAEATSTAHRTVALAAAGFTAAVVAATDNRLSAPLDCNVRERTGDKQSW